MSLHDMMKNGLPMNRKERFFTGTVFPMIVCANGFRDLGLLADLIPGCQLPPVETDPTRANIQFFTEYSLVESIYKQETKARFPHPPKTKDTPDVIILIKGQITVLIALEAKMYHQPQLHSLIKQLQAQRIQLDYMRERLNVHKVWHAALLPAGYQPELGRFLPAGKENGFHIIRWEELLASYRTVRPRDDYFVGVLDLALRDWENLCSQPLAYGVNAEGTCKGGAIFRRYSTDPSLSVMGRSGGLLGPAVAADIASGNWRNQDYEVSSAPEPPNKNWFYVKDFIRLITEGPVGAARSVAHPQEKRAQEATSGYSALTGEEILALAGDPSVKTVGRNGGLHGVLLAADIATGGWRTWSYAVSGEAKPRNKNWFTVEEFLAAVEATLLASDQAVDETM